MEEQIRFIAAATVALLIGIVVSDIIIFVIFARGNEHKVPGLMTKKKARKVLLNGLPEDRLAAMKHELEHINGPDELSAYIKQRGLKDKAEADSMSPWHPISAGKPIPIGMYVDVKDSQEIYTKVKLIKKQPAKWQPAFILHKKLTHWRYTK